MWMKLILIGFSTIVSLFSVSNFAQSIGIGQISNLNFPTAAQGDGNYTIPPTGSETAENASFMITGSSFTAYTIVLPTRVHMLHSSSSARVRVSKFKSIPAAGANGLLDSNGQQMLYVGAKRAKLGVNKRPGFYSISFSVTVVY